MRQSVDCVLPLWACGQSLVWRYGSERGFGRIWWPFIHVHVLVYLHAGVAVYPRGCEFTCTWLRIQMQNLLCTMGQWTEFVMHHGPVRRIIDQRAESHELHTEACPILFKNEAKIMHV
jgi:hypothetical protein